MLALAGIPLGFRFRFLEPKPDPPVADLGEVIRGEYDDPEALRAFRPGLSVVTYEFERVPDAAARELEGAAPVRPGPDALAVTQDRLTEKQMFRRLGVDTVPFFPVDRREDLEAAVDEIGLPAVLKTRRFGYDGKGQSLLRDRDDLGSAWAELGGRALLLEGFSQFRRELSIIAARGTDGRIRDYPVVENLHVDGILRISRSPVTDLSERLAGEARAIVRRILDDMDYVGVLAVELFETDEGLLANEMAPRVHNSGHWTLNGAVTSQFENHVRAVVGLPLGDPSARGWAAMVNLIGRVPDSARLLEQPGTHLHLYGKSPRPGRKLGHVNVTANSPEEREERIESVSALLSEEGG